MGEDNGLLAPMPDGEMDDPGAAAKLGDLADGGETDEEFAGAALAMRARMRRIFAPAGAIDVCGTGGDGQHSLNVSTAVAIVVAACGAPGAQRRQRAAAAQGGGPGTPQTPGPKPPPPREVGK